MGSSRGQDGSLGAGISLPQWMKGKIDNRFDFDDSSFSPPSHDDSFFYIRYRKSAEDTRENSTSGSQEGYRSISQVLNEKTSGSSGIVQVGSSSSGANVTKIKDVGNIDFSKHPLPCQPFVPVGGATSVKPATGTIGNKLKFSKSQGTDDGFHSEPALCGKSIVHVANRIMSRKIMKPDAARSEATETKRIMEQPNQEQFLTKGSKSLPVTPIASPISTPDSSPKSRRKVQSNRYFAGTLGADREKYQAGWILSSLFGSSREVTFNNKIQEEDEEAPSADVVPFKYLNRKKSISSQNLSYLGTEENRAVSTSSQQQQQQQQKQLKQAVYTNVFNAKPSELREMNFWSPTSM